MCFNYKTSIITFLIGTIGSLILIRYGNPKYKIENIIFGIFLIFIAGVQFMDFLLWIDLDNKFGINHIVTLIGPLFIFGQPLILYIIKLLYFRPKIWNFTNIGIALLNILYFICIINMYITFIQNGELITSTSHGHLSWPWIKYINLTSYFYLIMLAINMFYLTKFNYSLLFFLITYLFFYLSVKFFSYNIGELWCFFGSFIPMFMIFISFLI